MKGFFTGIGLLALGLAVVWLLAKMSRTDAADWRLTALGITVAAALVALVAGVVRRPGRGRRP